MHQPSLFTRNDTFFGVCEGLGQDLGINAQLLRLVFAGLLFWNPLATIAGYLAMGLFIAGLRFAFPDRTAAAVADKASTEELPADVEVEPVPVPLAA